ncbi:MAG: Dabb family protein [Lachnospiraceae bacterium]|nr:Dabb family protein [Lachnospiraceae bacterium]MBQ5849471.1 Dabb family protein [Lachnospiraceae bacterium]
MIRHICMFKFKEENKEQNIKEAVKRSSSLNEIKSLKRLEVVTNAEGTPESNYEFSLICDFDSIDDLNQYQKDPIHLEFGKFIKEVRDGRACIDYEF